MAVVLVTAAIIALSVFFGAIEFALVAARRYRLEELAKTSLATPRGGARRA